MATNRGCHALRRFAYSTGNLLTMILRRPSTPSAFPLLVSSKMIWAIVAAVRSLPVFLLLTLISSPSRINLARW